MNRIDFYSTSNLIALAIIAGASFGYTFLISFLFAEDFQSIQYNPSGGISAFIIGCLTILIVRKIDIYLYSTIKRSPSFVFLITLFLSIILTTTIVFFSSWFLNSVLKDQNVLTFSFFKELILILYFLLILILSYLVITNFTRSIAQENKVLKTDNIELNKELNKFLQRIPSLSNKRTILIPLREILFFRIESGVIFAYLINGQRSSIQITTLNSLEDKLNPSSFFRINRSELVQIDKVKSFEPYFKDRLSIKLIDNKTTLHTSNKKSAQFRKWLLGA